jgi:hypothetical protein
VRPAGTGPAPLPASALYLHHTVTAARNGPSIIRQVEAIGHQRFGAGISYTFLVTPDGTVYEGTGVARAGTHTRGLNRSGRAICCVGNYETTTPSPAMLRAVADLVRHGRSQRWWGDLTGGHRDAPGASTACPGRHLQAAIPEIRSLARSTPVTPSAPPPLPPEDDMVYQHPSNGWRLMVLADGTAWAGPGQSWGNPPASKVTQAVWDRLVSHYEAAGKLQRAG